MIYIYNNIGTFTKYHINIDTTGFQALLSFSWDNHFWAFTRLQSTPLYGVLLHCYPCIWMYNHCYSSVRERLNQVANCVQVCTQSAHLDTVTHVMYISCIMLQAVIASICHCQLTISIISIKHGFWMKCSQTGHPLPHRLTCFFYSGALSPNPAF